MWRGDRCVLANCAMTIYVVCHTTYSLLWPSHSAARELKELVYLYLSLAVGARCTKSRKTKSVHTGITGAKLGNDYHAVNFIKVYGLATPFIIISISRTLLSIELWANCTSYMHLLRHFDGIVSPSFRDEALVQSTEHHLLKP